MTHVPSGPLLHTTTDHLGSPRIITDQYGQVKSRRDFMPFGEDIFQNVGASRTASLGYSTSQDDIRQKFAGYQKDSETQLDFAEARMYENRFGRFTAVDPLLASILAAKPQSFNRYAYCLNRPFVYIDKSGMYPTERHNELLATAFPGLSSVQLKMLQYGSALVDTSLGTGGIIQIAGNGSAPTLSPIVFDFPRTLNPSEAHMHAMVPPGMTRDDAVAKADAYIESQINNAIIAQNAFDPSGRTISTTALVEFGKATHTMMDAYSPTHRFFQNYSIPMNTRHFEGVPYRVPAVLQFIQEMLAHKNGEANYTPEEEAKAVQLMRVNMLTGLGRNVFEQAVTNQADRDAIYSIVDQSRYTFPVPSSFTIQFSVPANEGDFRRSMRQFGHPRFFS